MLKLILRNQRHASARFQSSSDGSRSQGNNSPKSPHGNFHAFIGSLLLLFVLVAGIIYLSKERRPKDDFFEIQDGEPVLAPWREEKMLRELDEIDDAIQYALVVTVAGEYPCYHCASGQTTIQLEIGHTWKYGTTRKGETGRYRGQLPDPRLLFVSQFTGTYAACLKEEKRKIYQYAILPENQARAVPLIRPPGNKNDG